MTFVRRHTTVLSLVAACMLVIMVPAARSANSGQPNILWLSCEDISPHLACYGDPHAITPHLDQLAREGVRYTHAFTTAGVCAPCRSGIITGVYQTTLGTHHMRCTATLPDFIKPFPVALRQAGYYCTNKSKTDYQFRHPRNTWDKGKGKAAHWRSRPKKDQPFFAVFNFTGCHESGIANTGKYRTVTSGLSPGQRQDATKLTTFPPYYPDTPVAREDWKRNYELITAMDAWAGQLIEQLKKDGLYEETIIFFWSDHGIGLPRGKRWLYDSGTHVPLIVRVPEKYRKPGSLAPGQAKPGTVSDRLISSIDFGPTVLHLAGLDVPDHVQGRPFLGPRPAAPRDYVYGGRDRMDERYDIIRMVRDRRFQYIRNYEPLKTFHQYINTAEKGATMRELRKLHDAGQLRPAAERYFAPSKPVEELYDCTADPHELKNLAGDPKFADVLKRMRGAHLAWVRETRDLGLVPEAIIAAREKQLGSSYAILRQQDGDAYNAKLGTIAVQASSGLRALPDLIEAMEDADAAIRYWGATGIGNTVATARRTRGTIPRNLADSARNKLLAGLKDKSAAVRVASARALCYLDQPGPALPVLISDLRNGAQWERLQAAIVLDELDEQARPVLEQMRVGLKYQPGFNSDGKYRVRVINRALNELEGTDRKVK